ncbi:hypothetical protein [Nocardia macrotermitis]|uniref:Uncharacterized protein n=1 Tax=Nocardia macrotermitis TaxID=2585198 RepID=A0A7K0D341_9NOCA|nr:hypothetical protein [Nocardia macrotermitis]MQY20135.1 hypothetical protein [Nocardia macrotermitis]
MSGPTAVAYRITSARERLEDAQRRWRRLLGRSRAHSLRCNAFECPDLLVTEPESAPARDAETLEAACTRLEERIRDAESRLENRLVRQRSRRVEHDLSGLLDDLARREAAASAPVARPQAPDLDVPARVSRILASLSEDSPELTAAASAALRAEPHRTRLLLADLDARARAANRRCARRREQRLELEQLRCEAAGLDDPSAVSAQLRQADAALDGGGDAAAVLEHARITLERLTVAARAERDRRFVLSAVTESLAELGYHVAPVELDTADSIVLRPNRTGTHAIRARVSDDEIDLHTVRTGPATDREADRDADAALCAEVEPLLDELRRRGIQPGRVRRLPPGSVTPPEVRLTTPAAQTKRKAAPRTIDRSTS